MNFILTFAHQIFTMIWVGLCVIFGWGFAKTRETKEELKSAKKSRKIEDSNRNLTRKQLSDKL